MLTNGGMVIVGAGHAGCRAAEALRANGHVGAITIIEMEDRHPYERPPLSKAVLQGKKRPADAPILAPDWFDGHDVAYLNSSPVVGIRRDARDVELADGTTVGYQHLLLAPGAEPNDLTIRGRQLKGVTLLRRAVDAERLAASLRPGARIVIIGGGLIGLEVAASASLMGCIVTIIEAGPRLLTRAIPAEIEREVRECHQRAGVDVRLGCTVASFDGHDNVSAVTLGSGEEIACEAAVICIGVKPRTDLARAAGIAVDNGIVVDRHLRTSDPAIFAAGDACVFESGLYATNVRLECWKNAEDQGQLVALNMLGQRVAYDAVPWMWSDQFDNVIQIAGLPHLSATSVERRTSQALLVFHIGNDGRLLGVSGFGAVGVVARGVRSGLAMIERRLAVEPSVLSDSRVDLREVLRREAA